ncbi:MAG: DUF2244 domain-containing protein [Pseudolabrys sp.]|nr:DUF2244 domain-containing protein [Pseudolabrys sp.]
MTLDNRPFETGHGGEEIPPLFSAVITPHRSLPHPGFLLLMAFVCFVSFVAGLVFFMAGAWPVFGFFGLDVVLLYWAFRINYRAALAYEEISVSPVALRVRKVSPRGRVREWVLNPAWVTLDSVRHEEFGIERLFLVSRGKTLTIAGFLGPDEKAEFMRAFRRALWQAKQGYRPDHLPA